VFAGLLGLALALLTTLPLAWKWELGLRRVGAAVTILAVTFGLVAAAVGIGGLLGALLVWVMTVLAALALLAYRFYRDPDRTPPEDEQLVVSPADGEVIYVREAREGTVPVASKHGRDYSLEELARTELRSEDAVVIGIAMSFLDVHINRAPIGGRVTLQRHFPGLFGSLKNFEMMLENERATTVIEHGDLQVAVVQIASRLVRQIASFIHEGDEIARGQRIGVIRLGSQVDVVLPARDDIQVTVQAGEHVRAGESVLAIVAPSQREDTTVSETSIRS
jgi:phosphatidylserine decarboxylase